MESYKPKNVTQLVDRSPKDNDKLKELKEKIFKTVDGESKPKKKEKKNG